LQKRLKGSWLNVSIFLKSLFMIVVLSFITFSKTLIPLTLF
jgi:hypothetical protein